MESFEYYQDFIGQLPMLKTYLHFCMGFAIHDEDFVAHVGRIRSATRQMVEAFPWLAAQVVTQGRHDGVSGLTSMVPCEAFGGNLIRNVKDCRDLVPPYAKILESEASLKVLDGSILGPRTAFPLSYDESEDEPAPVVAVQINHVRGGLLLNWACQHNVMDAAGLSHAIHLFSLAMRNKPFAASAMDWGNRRRRDLVPLLQAGELALEHLNLKRSPVARPAVSPGPFLAFEWLDFNISAESLRALKKLASDSQHFVDPCVSFVSTNDALTAFCWQRIANARVQLGRPRDADVKLARALDARSVMGVSPEYMGHMVYIATSFLKLDELASKPLAYVASALRKSLVAASSQHEVRSFATLISKTEDKSTIAFAGQFNPDVDAGSSSGLAMRWQGDYGPLGRPDFMNRPRFTPLPSTIYVMPMRPDDSVDVQLSLRPDELARIREDDTWRRYLREL